MAWACSLGYKELARAGPRSWQAGPEGGVIGWTRWAACVRAEGGAGLADGEEMLG